MNRGRALITLIAVLTLLAPTAASTHALLEQPWHTQERHVEFDGEPDHRFQARSIHDSDDGFDVLETAFNVDETAYHVSFLHTDPATPDDASPLTMTLDFIDLVRFHDQHDDDAFSPPADQIQHRTPLDDPDASTLTLHERDDAHEAIWTYETPHATLNVTFHIAPTQHTHQGTQHPPTLTNLDIRITDHADGTNPALHTRLTTNTTLQPDANNHAAEAPLPHDDHGFKGLYAWEPNLTGTNHQATPLVVELPPDDDPHRSHANILFAYPPGQTLHHTAQIGVAHDATLQERVLTLIGDWSLFSLGIFGSLLVLGATLYHRIDHPLADPP